MRPADIAERSLSGEYRFFLGNLHAHSGFSGDHAKTIATKFNNGVANYDLHQPAEVLARAATNHYDFYFITDHSSPEQNEFYRNGFTDAHWAKTEEQVMAACGPAFLAMRGYEFSRNNDPDAGGLGHMNVLNSKDWNSAYAAGHTFAWLYDWMVSVSQTGPVVVAQFNHPQMPGKPKVKNFKDYSGRTKERNEVVRLAEIWNSTENLNYVRTVQKIWALGWKVAPTGNNDVHGIYGLENRRMRTGVLAESLTRENIMAALKARRVYATVEPVLHFDFMMNGHAMGTALESAPEGPLEARVFANDPAGAVISRVEIFGGDYEPPGGAGTEPQRLTSIPLGKSVKTGKAVVPGGHDFYYAVAFKEGAETPRAFSSPIWMDNR